jgi:hypothetical protein
MRPMLGGKVEERQRRVAGLEQAIDGLLVFGRIFSAEVAIAASAAAQFVDSQISRKSPCALGRADFGGLSRTISVLCRQHRR